MLSFSQYLTEAADGKNTHLEHLEDLVFNEGVTGTRKAINSLRAVRDMLAGHSKSATNITTKWDGAPAIFAGVDPEDGQFFVAKKGLFNKTPQMFKSVEDIKASGMSAELQSKFIPAFEEFSKLGIKSGVFQGDLMFTKEDLSKEKIEGKSYITFQPNTIVYAVPAESPLAKTLKSSRIGVVWHTTYTGKTIQDMKASFGKSIVNKMKSIPSVWMDDATYKDLSGSATFTEKETEVVTSMLSQAGKLFNKIPARALNSIADDGEFLIRLKAFNNSKVRASQSITNSRKHVNDMVKYFQEYYGKEIDKRKSEKGKDVQRKKLEGYLKTLESYKDDLYRIYDLVIILTKAKKMIVDKLNSAGSMGTFLRTRDGFKVTDQEGYVAIDHVGNAIKLVDRMEFSRANFSPDVIKGFELPSRRG